MRADKGFVEEHRCINHCDEGQQDPARHAVSLGCFYGDMSSPVEVGVDVDPQVLVVPKNPEAVGPMVGYMAPSDHGFFTMVVLDLVP